MATPSVAKTATTVTASVATMVLNPVVDAVWSNWRERIPTVAQRMTTMTTCIGPTALRLFWRNAFAFFMGGDSGSLFISVLREERISLCQDKRILRSRSQNEASA